jgi:hypothetical protein
MKYLLLLVIEHTLIDLGMNIKQGSRLVSYFLGSLLILY